MFSLRYIASGSLGNCCLLSDEDTKLIIDVGIPLKTFKEGLENFNETASSHKALLLTHEHGDHISGARKIMEEYTIPCYLSKGTYDNSNLIDLPQFRVKDIHLYKSFRIDSLKVFAFEVDHDAAQPIGFLFENGYGERLAFIADCGNLEFEFDLEADVYAIELNHSIDILNRRLDNEEIGVKRYDRIAGEFGHTELMQVVAFMEEHPDAKYVFHHLSKANLDLDMVHRTLGAYGFDYQIAEPGETFMFGEVDPY